MTNSNTKPIDGARLEELLRNRGLKAQDVSEELGYSRKQIAQAIRRGTMSKPMLTALRGLYNIQYDDIAPLRETPEALQVISHPGDIIEDAILSNIDRIAERIGEEVGKALAPIIREALGQEEQYPQIEFDREALGQEEQYPQIEFDREALGRRA